MLREELPDVAEEPGPVGVHTSPAVEGVHVLMCPIDSEVSEMISLTRLIFRQTNSLIFLFQVGSLWRTLSSLIVSSAMVLE